MKKRTEAEAELEPASATRRTFLGSVLGILTLGAGMAQVAAPSSEEAGRSGGKRGSSATTPGRTSRALTVEIYWQAPASDVPFSELV